MSVMHFDGDHTRAEADLTCLANRRRREVLRVLRRAGPVLDRRTLAERVADAENDSSDDAIENVEITLHHVHLPKLEDAGVLRYDSQRGRITRD